MVIELYLRANRDRVIINVPQADINLDLKNVVGYIQGKESVSAIVAYGRDSEDLQGDFSNEWVKVKSNLTFAQPFDPDHFDPYLAASFIYNAAHVANAKMARPVILGYHLNLFVYDCHLNIEGYDNMPPDMQTEFEYRLRDWFGTRIRHFLINDRDTAPRHRQLFWAVILINATTIITGMSVLVGGISLSGQYVIDAFMHRSNTILMVLGLAVLYLAGIGILFHIGFYIGILAALMLLRQFLPRSLLRNIVKLEPLSLYKPIKHWVLVNIIGEK